MKREKQRDKRDREKSKPHLEESSREGEDDDGRWLCFRQKQPWKRELEERSKETRGERGYGLEKGYDFLKETKVEKNAKCGKMGFGVQNVGGNWVLGSKMLEGIIDFGDFGEFGEFRG